MFEDKTNEIKANMLTGPAPLKHHHWHTDLVVPDQSNREHQCCAISPVFSTFFKTVTMAACRFVGVYMYYCRKLCFIFVFLIL